MSQTQLGSSVTRVSSPNSLHQTLSECHNRTGTSAIHFQRQLTLFIDQVINMKHNTTVQNKITTFNTRTYSSSSIQRGFEKLKEMDAHLEY